MLITSVPLALLAAFLFAVGSVLQKRAGRLWFVGMGADAVGYGAHAAALAAGKLAIVQPLLGATVVFALPLGAALERRRVTRRELLAALAVTCGLGIFLALADPSGGHNDASPGAWLAVLVACAGVCAVALWRRGPVPLGIATGVLFGLSAALTKATVERLDDGVLHALLDWHALVLLVVGFASVALSQASLRAGSLGTAVAAQMSLDAISSLLIGVFAFGERLHAGPFALTGALAGVALAITGIAVLATATAPERVRT